LQNAQKQSPHHFITQNFDLTEIASQYRALYTRQTLNKHNVQIGEVNYG